MKFNKKLAGAFTALAAFSGLSACVEESNNSTKAVTDVVLFDENGQLAYTGEATAANYSSYCKSMTAEIDQYGKSLVVGRGCRILQ